MTETETPLPVQCQCHLPAGPAGCPVHWVDTPLSPVKSTNVAAIGYASVRQALLVQYKSSQEVYLYYGVSPEKYQAFLAAESKGAFLATQVKALHTYAKKGDPADPNQRVPETAKAG